MSRGLALPLGLGYYLFMADEHDGTKTGLTIPTVMDVFERESVERIALDIPLRDFKRLERFAAYRNAMARAQGKKMLRLWSRKSITESLIIAQFECLWAALSEMFAAVGELPPANDQAAMDRYAKKVITWASKLKTQP